jgi:hypothetical protein
LQIIHMRKALLIAVIFFSFFISRDIFGQQNTNNTENAPKAESSVEDSKPGNVNSTSPGPNIPGNINKDNGNSAKELSDIQKTRKTDDSKNSDLKIDVNNKKTEQKPLPVIKQIPDKPINGNGLIEINDGDFKYNRIPGISLYTEKPIEKALTEKNTEKKVNEAKDLSEVNDKKDKPLFGIKKSTAVIILLIVLIVIIIVFKIRSKTMGGKNVLKRFPGMK